MKHLINKVHCEETIEFMKQIADKSIDAIICDLPYGTTACSWDTMIPFEPLWEAYKRIIKPNGAIVLFGSQPFTSSLIMSNLKMFSHCWVWNKRKGGNPWLAKKQPIKITEDVIVFKKGKVVYNPIMELREKPVKRGKNKGKKSESINNAFIEDRIYIKKYPKNIIDISNANQLNRLHPTQKPVALMEYLVKTYTNAGDLILDNTCGSGSTLVAAERLGRNWIGCEISENYCEIARTRIHNERNGRLFDPRKELESETPD